MKPVWKSTCRYRRRQGAALVVVLLIMMLLSLITVSLLSTLSTTRTAARLESRRAQAWWLAESGLERAIRKLDADPNYHGETWSVPAAELGGDREAAVVITVATPAGSPAHRTVRVRADYPATGTDRARRTLETEIAVPAASSPAETRKEQAP